MRKPSRALMLAALLAAGCTQQGPAPFPAVAAAPRVPGSAGSMVRAKTCTFPPYSADRFGGAVTVVVSNDGGTCWRDLSRQGMSGAGGGGFAIFTGGSVVQPPQHGEAQANLVAGSLLRVAYRPAAGYIGPDSFRYTAQPSGVTTIVTVDVVAR